MKIYGCRELIKTMDCNKKLVSLLEEDTPKPKIQEVSTALLILDKPIQDLIDKTTLIGTAWYLPEVPKSIAYHSLASNVECIFSDLLSRMGLPLEAKVKLSAKEKSLGYEGGYTVKITRKDNNEASYNHALCYITLKAEVCDVPKKQSNSTGKGMMITDVICDNASLTLGEMLDVLGLKKKTVIEWLKDTAFREINDYSWEINVAVEQGNFVRVRDFSGILSCCTEKLYRQIDKANDLD